MFNPVRVVPWVMRCQRFTCFGRGHQAGRAYGLVNWRRDACGHRWSTDHRGEVVGARGRIDT